MDKSVASKEESTQCLGEECFDLFVRRQIPAIDGVYVKGSVESVDVIFTVDTGASISLLSKKIFDEIPCNQRPDLHSKVPQLKGASGRDIPCYGTAYFQLQFGPLYLEKKLLVADITDDILIGADVLLGDKAGPADLLFSRQIIIFRNVEIPIEVDGYPRVRKVTMADTCVLPPMSESLVDVYVERLEDEKDSDFVIEPCKSLAEKYQVVMASSVTDINRSITHKVRILNPFMDTVVIPQDTVVGQAEVAGEIVVFDEMEDANSAGNVSAVRRVHLCSKVSEVSQNGVQPVKTVNTDSTSEDETEESLDLSKFEVPEHLQTLFKETCAGKSEEQVHVVAQFLSKYQDVFSRNDTDIGRTHLTEHVIETGNAPPFKLPPRRIPLAYVGEAEEAIQNFFDQGSIRPSTSPWASPLVFVRKKNGQLRPCVDYRRLNQISRKDAFPLPRIEDCFDAVSGATLFSSMDITSAYNQIPIRSSDIPKTAFVTRYGLFEFITMPFGLSGSPATFQRCLELALAGLQWKICLIYLDDILVFANQFEEMMDRLGQVLERIREAQLKLKPSKCQFLQKEVAYLGHILSAEGVKPNPDNVEKVQKWHEPKTVKEVQSFLGLANYYRRFISGYSEIARPLIDLTRKGAMFEFTDECRGAFEKIKQALISPPVMAHPKSDGLFVLDTDACDVCIGACLSQIQDGEERVIAYGSKSLSKTERNYCVTDRELLAVRYFCEYYRAYLLGRHFLVRTDHQALKWLFSMKEPKSRIARWIEALSEFDFEIEHRDGRKHNNADAMSRCPNPWTCSCKNFEKLRCGPCKKCQRKNELMNGSFPGEDKAQRLVFDEMLDETCTFEQEAGWSTITRHFVQFLSLFLLMVLVLYSELESHVADELLVSLMPCLVLYHDILWTRLFGVITCLLPFFKGILAVKEDGRTRPKLHFSIFRGFRERIAIGKTDLRSAWPLATKFIDLPSKQLEDPDLKIVIGWLKDGKRPERSDVQATSPAVRHYWLYWDSLVLKDGVLHKYYYRSDQTRYLQIIVPRSLRKEVLFHMHDSVLSGHLGYKKTKWKLLQKFYWHEVRHDIYIHIQTCDVCTSIKRPTKTPKAPLGNMLTGAPLDRLSTDICGPFPVSNMGNRYILVVTDYFSKWVEIFAVPDQTAVTCADRILNEVICRYGCPYDLHSDQGTNYTSKIFSELCSMLEIRKTRSSPYNPRCNGQVERFNKTLVSMIKAYLKDEGKDWDKHLGCLGAAYRSTIHESTNFTPNMLFLGREVRLPAHLMFEAPDSPNFSNYGDYVEALRLKMERAHDLARLHLGKSAKRQKDGYDSKCMLHKYNPGDLVWYANLASQLHLPPKLRKSFCGPLLILEKKNDLNYVIQMNAKKETKLVHHNRLLPYKGNQCPRWIQNARKNLRPSIKKVSSFR